MRPKKAFLIAAACLFGCFEAWILPSFFTQTQSPLSDSSLSRGNVDTSTSAAVLLRSVMEDLKSLETVSEIEKEPSSGFRGNLEVMSSMGVRTSNDIEVSDSWRFLQARDTCTLISACFGGAWASWCNNWNGLTMFNGAPFETTVLATGSWASPDPQGCFVSALSLPSGITETVTVSTTSGGPSTPLFTVPPFTTTNEATSEGLTAVPSSQCSTLTGQCSPGLPSTSEVVLPTSSVLTPSTLLSLTNSASSPSTVASSALSSTGSNLQTSVDTSNSGFISSPGTGISETTEATLISETEFSMNTETPSSESVDGTTTAALPPTLSLPGGSSSSDGQISSTSIFVSAEATSVLVSVSQTVQQPSNHASTMSNPSSQPQNSLANPSYTLSLAASSPATAAVLITSTSLDTFTVFMDGSSSISTRTDYDVITVSGPSEAVSASSVTINSSPNQESSISAAGPVETTSDAETIPITINGTPTITASIVTFITSISGFLSSGPLHVSSGVPNPPQLTSSNPTLTPLSSNAPNPSAFTVPSPSPLSSTMSCDFGIQQWCVTAGASTVTAGDITTSTAVGVTACLCPLCILGTEECLINIPNPTNCPTGWLCTPTISAPFSTADISMASGLTWPGTSDTSIWSIFPDQITMTQTASTTGVTWSASLSTHTSYLAGGLTVLFPFRTWQCIGPLCVDPFGWFDVVTCFLTLSCHVSLNGLDGWERPPLPILPPIGPPGLASQTQPTTISPTESQTTTDLSISCTASTATVINCVESCWTVTDTTPVLQTCNTSCLTSSGCQASESTSISTEPCTTNTVTSGTYYCGTTTLSGQTTPTEVCTSSNVTTVIGCTNNVTTTQAPACSLVTSLDPSIPSLLSQWAAQYPFNPSVISSIAASVNSSDSADSASAASVLQQSSAASVASELSAGSSFFASLASVGSVSSSMASAWSVRSSFFASLASGASSAASEASIASFIGASITSSALPSTATAEGALCSTDSDCHSVSCPGAGQAVCQENYCACQ